MPEPESNNIMKEGQLTPSQVDILPTQPNRLRGLRGWITNATVAAVALTGATGGLPHSASANSEAPANPAYTRQIHGQDNSEAGPSPSPEPGSKLPDTAAFTRFGGPDFKIVGPSVPDPVNSPSPAPGETIDPSAQPTESPAPTEAIPTLQENCTNWMAPAGTAGRIELENRSDRFYNGTEAWNFGEDTAVVDAQHSDWGRNFGYSLGAIDLGKGRIVLIVGLEDKSGNRYTTAMRAGLDGRIGVGRIPNADAGGGNLAEKVITPDELYTNMVDGNFLNRPVYFENLIRVISKSDKEGNATIPHNKAQQAFIHEATNSNDYTTIEPRPDFINNLDIQPEEFTKLPTIFDLGINLLPSASW
jgi:hypothetical protein